MYLIVRPGTFFSGNRFKKNKLIAIPCIYRRLQKKDTGTDGAEAYPDVNKGHFSEMRLPDRRCLIVRLFRGHWKERNGDCLPNMDSETETEGT